MCSKIFGLVILPITLAPAILYVLRDTSIVQNFPPVTIETGLGTIRGIKPFSRDGRRFNSFTGIPYAKPPIGKLRFQPPVKSEEWNGILDATLTAPDCIQMDIIFKSLVGQENCLYLNVYTPQLKTSKEGSKQLLPVMVYIHGGHFMCSSSAMIGPHYFMDEDVILVTMNYRLGAMGFLNTGDGEVTGNMGLKDQSMALKWVQDNIHEFGGDKDAVTISGHSAGGASVNYHMLSPMSKGLFQKAVSMAGSSLCPWGFTRQPKEQANILGNRLSCPTTNSKVLVDCLLEKSAEEIIETQRDFINIFHAPEAVYAPSIENLVDKRTGFLTESPTDILRAGKQLKVPFITGINSEEGCYRSPLVIGNPDKLSELNTDWNNLASKAFILYNASTHETHGRIRQFYFGKDTEIGFQHIDNLTNAYSDRFFLSCVKDVAMFHSEVAPTFLYHFSHQGDFTISLILSAASTTSGPVSFFFRFAKEILRMKLYNFMGWEIENYGCCHIDDALEIFQWLPFLKITPGSSHYAFSKSLVKLWVEVASTEPKKLLQLSFNGVRWEPITGKNPRYLNLGDHVAMIDEPFTERLEFWKTLNLPNN